MANKFPSKGLACNKYFDEHVLRYLNLVFFSFTMNSRYKGLDMIRVHIRIYAVTQICDVSGFSEFGNHSLHLLRDIILEQKH